MDQETFNPHLQLLSVAFFIVACTNFIAWKFGYFSFVNRGKKRGVSFFSVILIFALYLFIQVFLIPIIVLVGVSVEQGVIVESLSEVLSTDALGWINVSAIFTATTICFIYSLLISRKIVWNPGSLSIRQQCRSILLGICSWFLAFPWVIVTGQIVIIISIYIYKQQPPEIDQEMIKYLKSLLGSPLLFVATSLLVMVAVPVAEEIIFRGYLQSWLRSYFPPFITIFLTSLIFSFLHYTSGQGVANFQLLPSLFVLSCFMGFLYERQQTLLAPIALHITFNTISILMLIL